MVLRPLGVLQREADNRPSALPLRIKAAEADGEEVGVGGGPAQRGDVAAAAGLRLKLPQRQQRALVLPNAVRWIIPVLQAEEPREKNRRTGRMIAASVEYLPTLKYPYKRVSVLRRRVQLKWPLFTRRAGLAVGKGAL